MVGLIAGTFCYCIVSALVPLINAEAYVSAFATTLTGAPALWALAITAAAGQMVGKTVYFLVGRSSLDWAWVRRKTASPRWQAVIERWQRRIGDRPWIAAAVLLLSAYTGIPPLMIVAVLAGQLRVPLPLFIVIGFIGRCARFASIVGVVHLVFEWFQSA